MGDEKKEPLTWEEYERLFPELQIVPVERTQPKEPPPYLDISSDAFKDPVTKRKLPN